MTIRGGGKGKWLSWRAWRVGSGASNGPGGNPPLGPKKQNNYLLIFSHFPHKIFSLLIIYCLKVFYTRIMGVWVQSMHTVVQGIPVSLWVDLKSERSRDRRRHVKNRLSLK